MRVMTTADSRKKLSSDNIAPEALSKMASFHSEVVAHVASEVASHRVVVVGMKQNPVVKKARKALDDLGAEYTYLEYGSYMGEWKKRLALKLWSGWPTFPQVFVDGTLLGGADELIAAIASGKFKN